MNVNVKPIMFADVRKLSPEERETALAPLRARMRETEAAWLAIGKARILVRALGASESESRALDSLYIRANAIALAAHDAWIDASCK
jgi:ribosomal protein L10